MNTKGGFTVRKITQENMKEVADSLLKSVGTEDFGKGKIYYKDGTIKLSTKQLSNTLYVNNQKLAEFYGFAKEAVEQRKRGAFKEYLYEFAKERYVADLVEGIKKFKEVQSYVIDSEGIYQSSRFIQGRTVGSSFLGPVNREQEAKFIELKRVLTELGATVELVSSTSANIYGVYMNSGIKNQSELVQLKNQILNGDAENLVTVYLNNDRDVISFLSNFLTEYTKYVKKYEGIDQKLELIKDRLRAYLIGVSVSSNDPIIKEIESLGYKVNKLIIANHKVNDIYFEHGRDTADIVLRRESDGKNELQIQTTSVGSLNAFEMTTYLDRYTRALRVVELLTTLDNFYYIKTSEN